MDNKRRRQLLRQSLALASAATVAGCTGGQGGNNQNGDSGSGGSTSNNANWVYTDVNQASSTDKIVAFNLDSMSGDPATRAHFEGFREKTDVNVKPKAVPQTNALSKARTLLQSKSHRPDVYEFVDSMSLTLGRKGYFEKVDSFVTTADAWADAAREVCQWPAGQPGFGDYPYPKGLYMTPYYVNGWMQFVNEQTLKQAGLDPKRRPTTFTQVLDVCNKLSGTVDYPMLFPLNNVGNATSMFYNLVQRAGGHIYKNGKPKVTNEGFVNAAEFVLTLFRKGYTPGAVTSMGEGEVTSTFFTKGRGGLMFNPLANLFLTKEKLPISKPAAKVAHPALFPKPEGAGDTPTGDMGFVGYNLSIFSRHKEMGARYMNYTTTKQAQVKAITVEGNMPIRPDVFDMQKVQDQVPYTDTLQKHLAGLGHFTYPHSSRVDQIVYSTLTSAIANNWSAKKMVQRIQSELEGLSN